MTLPARATIPNNIANGDSADAATVMANFNALRDAINDPLTPDMGYDDIAKTWIYTNGLPTSCVGTRAGVQVYSATVTWTNGLPTSVAETIGPSGSQVTKTTTFVYTNGVLTSTTIS